MFAIRTFITIFYGTKISHSEHDEISRLNKFHAGHVFKTIKIAERNESSNLRAKFHLVILIFGSLGDLAAFTELGRGVHCRPECVCCTHSSPACYPCKLFGVILFSLGAPGPRERGPPLTDS